MTAILTWNYTYLLILLFSLAGLGLADWRWRLVLFDSPKAAMTTIALLVVFFLAWDITGLWLEIFSTNQVYVSGLYIVTPNLPIEEVLFLTLLNYVVLLCYQALHRTRGADA